MRCKTIIEEFYEFQSDYNHSKMLSWFSTVVFFLISSELAFALEVRTCSSKKSLPLSIDVDGCQKEPCKAVNKKTIHFAINFEVCKLHPAYFHCITILYNFFSAEEIQKLRAHARAFLEGVQLPYEVPKEDFDACKFLKNATCPLQKGEIVHYELIVPVNAPVTGPTVDMEFELIADNEIIIFCIRCKMHIVDK